MLYWDISAYWRYILPIALWLLWEKVLIVSLWGTLSLPGLPVTLARCWILMNRSSDPPPGPVCQPSSCHKQPQKSKPRQSRRHVQRPGDSKSATPHPSEGFHCGHGHGWTRGDTGGHGHRHMCKQTNEVCVQAVHRAALESALLTNSWFTKRQLSGECCSRKCRRV